MNSPNLVIVHYNQYAGGKFFINCLAHHPKILPGLGVSDQHPRDQWMLDNLPAEEKQRQKIDLINKTLPSSKDMYQWAQYELGCKYFWGDFFWALLQNPTLASAHALSLLENYVCFLVNHTTTLDTFNQTRKTWPSARHIILTNFDQFQKRAHMLKNPNHAFFRQYLPAGLEQSFYVDVDQTYHDADAIKQVVSSCVKWLGLNPEFDFNLDWYIAAYQRIHF